MPINPDPVANGNIIADLAQGVGVVVPTAALTDMKTDTPDEPFYLSHFVTCPQASEWRRK